MFARLVRVIGVTAVLFLIPFITYQGFASGALHERCGLIGMLFALWLIYLILGGIILVFNWAAVLLAAGIASDICHADIQPRPTIARKMWWYVKETYLPPRTMLHG